MLFYCALPGATPAESRASLGRSDTPPELGSATGELAAVVLSTQASKALDEGDAAGAAQGEQEALALLYRGSISRVIDLAHVEIQESDTEGDCVRRVETAGHAAFPDYFRGITGTWIRLAYAGVSPADSEVHALCQQWPFGERREA